MRRFLPLVAILIAACAPQDADSATGQNKKKKPPEMKLQVSQSPDALAAAEQGEVRVQVSPPEGIDLNRYPGITLTIEDAAGLTLGSEKAFVGSKKPIKNPEEFAFESIEPLRLAVTAPSGIGKGDHTMSGTLKFFYCRKKDGFCAPATQKVSVPVKTR
jgi:hypothetical protein